MRWVIYKERRQRAIVPHIHWLDKVSEPSSLALASGVTGGGNIACS